MNLVPVDILDDLLPVVIKNLETLKKIERAQTAEDRGPHGSSRIATNWQRRNEMKMLRAIIRPEKESAVASALAQGGFPAMTKWDVLGRGKQQGVQVGGQLYDELAKSMLMVVIEDQQVEEAVQIIQAAASTGFPGDGRTFVSDVDAAYTLRTGQSGL